MLLGARWHVAQPQNSASSPQQTGTEFPSAQANNSADLLPPGTNAATASKLVVDLSDRRVYVYQRDRVQSSYLLAIGRSDWETPTGNFQVRQLEKEPTWQHPISKIPVPPGPKNPLGARWIGFWTNGIYHIGFHGTNQEGRLGEAVSHGCLRMRNEDIMALYDRVAVGTPVQVRP